MTMTLAYRDSRGNRGAVDLDETSEVYIGRSKECRISTDDASVSRKHAVVRAENGQLFIQDLGSSGGTFVNDYRIEKHQLSPDDVIKCGSMWIRLVNGALPADWLS